MPTFPRQDRGGWRGVGGGFDSVVPYLSSLKMNTRGSFLFKDTESETAVCVSRPNCSKVAFKWLNIGIFGCGIPYLSSKTSIAKGSFPFKDTELRAAFWRRRPNCSGEG